MTKYKIVIDTSVIISASLNHICNEYNGLIIKDRFYDISKPLFNHFRDNIDLYQGVLTSEVEKSAKIQIVKAVRRNISRNTNIPEEIIRRQMGNYAITLMLVLDSLNKHIELLVRAPINEIKLDLIVIRVKKVFDKIKNDLPKKDPRKKIEIKIKSAPFGLHSLFKKFAKEDEESNFGAYKKLSTKLIDLKPDKNDFRILSQAIYLKENNIFENCEILLASNDQHFSKIREEEGNLARYISDEIEKRFHIKCGWPDEILEIIRK